MKYPKYKIGIFALVFGLVLTATVCERTNAAELFFSNPDRVGTGQNLYLRVMISPEDFINAVEGEIGFDSRFLEFQSASTGSSVVPLWIESPKVIHDGIIKFSGIIPGGVGPVLSKEGRLFDLVFKTKSAGQTVLTFNNYKVYLNTPMAEEAAARSKSLTINIVSAAAPEKEAAKLILDFYPPEPFKIYIVRNPEFFENQYVAVFSAQDKESGIDHYEIKERFLGFSGDWNKGESPYKLLHQSLFSIIEVRAIDGVGHERLEKIVPHRIIYLLIGILLGVFLILIWLIIKIILRFKR